MPNACSAILTYIKNKIGSVSDKPLFTSKLCDASQRLQNPRGAKLDGAKNVPDFLFTRIGWTSACSAASTRGWLWRLLARASPSSDDPEGTRNVTFLDVFAAIDFGLVLTCLSAPLVLLGGGHCFLAAFLATVGLPAILIVHVEGVVVFKGNVLVEESTVVGPLDFEFRRLASWIVGYTGTGAKAARSTVRCGICKVSGGTKE